MLVIQTSFVLKPAKGGPLWGFVMMLVLGSFTIRNDGHLLNPVIYCYSVGELK